MVLGSISEKLPLAAYYSTRHCCSPYWATPSEGATSNTNRRDASPCTSSKGASPFPPSGGAEAIHPTIDGAGFPILRQKVKPLRVSLPRVHKESRHPPMPTHLQRRSAFCPTGLQKQSLQHLEAISTFQPHVNHIYNDLGKKETIDTLLSSKDATTWTTLSVSTVHQ
jgi:hypothetical protein